MPIMLVLVIIVLPTMIAVIGLLHDHHPKLIPYCFLHRRLKLGWLRLLERKILNRWEAKERQIETAGLSPDHEFILTPISPHLEQTEIEKYVTEITYSGTTTAHESDLITGCVVCGAYFKASEDVHICKPTDKQMTDYKARTAPTPSDLIDCEYHLPWWLGGND